MTSALLNTVFFQEVAYTDAYTDWLLTLTAYTDAHTENLSTW